MSRRDPNTPSALVFAKQVRCARSLGVASYSLASLGWAANFLYHGKPRGPQSDLQPESICVPAFWISISGAGNNGHAPGSYHNAGAVVSFGDGHVELHRWQDPDTLKPIRHGYGRQASIDHEWIVDRATVELR